MKAAKTTLNLNQLTRMAAAFSFPIRVYIEDTDAGGIVYHANHVRYFERARTEWMRAQHIDHYWNQHDYSFVVHHIAVDYIKPILMDDLIEVTVEITSCKLVSFQIKQQIWRKDGLLATASVTMACLDAQLKPRRIPTFIHDLLVQSVQA